MPKTKKRRFFYIWIGYETTFIDTPILPFFILHGGEQLREIQALHTYLPNMNSYYFQFDANLTLTTIGFNNENNCT